MSGRSQPYYRQIVKATELDEIISDSNTQHKRLPVADGTTGIKSGLVVSENSPADSSVNVSAGIAVSKSGEYIYVPTIQNVPLTLYIPATDNRYISIFAAINFLYQDARIDGHGNTVYYRKVESYTINIVAGTAMSPPPLPALDSENILLADVLLTPSHLTNPVLNADIDTSRREIPLVQKLDDVSGNITINEMKIKTYTGGTTPPVLHADNYLALWINASGQVFLIYQKTGGTTVTVELS